MCVIKKFFIYFKIRYFKLKLLSMKYSISNLFLLFLYVIT